jgi:uncharacterized protein YceK
MHSAYTKMLVRTACLSLLLISSGCGTMVSHFHDCGGTPPPGVYRGTVFDASCIAGPFASEPHVELLPIGLIDLPFSFAADTIIFPFDLADYIDRKKSKKDTTRQPNKALEPTAVGAFTFMTTDNITSLPSVTPLAAAVAQLGR